MGSNPFIYYPKLAIGMQTSYNDTNERFIQFYTDKLDHYMPCTSGILVLLV